MINYCGEVKRSVILSRGQNVFRGKDDREQKEP